MNRDSFFEVMIDTELLGVKDKYEKPVVYHSFFSLYQRFQSMLKP